MEMLRDLWLAFRVAAIMGAISLAVLGCFLGFLMGLTALFGFPI
jgi:hypothetical protein